MSVAVFQWNFISKNRRYSSQPRYSENQEFVICAIKLRVSTDTRLIELNEVIAYWILQKEWEARMGSQKKKNSIFLFSQGGCMFILLISVCPVLCTDINKRKVYRAIGEGNGSPLQYSCLENPMDRSLVGCSPWGHEESDKIEQLHFHFLLSWIGEGNGDSLQCSCLENPRDSRAW